MQKLARVAFKTNNVDNCARICHGPSVAGLSLSFGSGAATNPFEDVLNSDLILMWGSNAVEAHPLAGRRVMQAKQKGIPIIVVDPGTVRRQGWLILGAVQPVYSHCT